MGWTQFKSVHSPHFTFLYKILDGAATFVRATFEPIDTFFLKMRMKKYKALVFNIFLQQQL
jgi:hypothetical protein